MHIGAYVILVLVLFLRLSYLHQIDTKVKESSIIQGNNLTIVQELRKKPRSIIASMYLSKPIKNKFVGKSTACKWLKGYKKQFQQCQNRRGFDKVVQDAKNLVIHNCREQFSYDRWDCSKVQNSMFKRIYRETAFMQALAASALMYSVAKACSDGKLQSCYCMERPRKSKSNWKWVGCSDNTKVAKKITRRFLLDGNHFPAGEQSSSKNQLKFEILKNNIDIGFQTIKKHKINVCVCHGVSATCSLKTCWKVIKPAFSNIAESLKAKYNSAMLYKPEKLTDTTENLSELLFLAQSPNFCEATHGRRCKNHNHCATLCCGRGYSTVVVTVDKRCNCTWNELNIDCKICTTNEDHLMCK